MLNLKIFPFCFLTLGLFLFGSCAEKVSIAEIKADGFSPKNTNPFGSDYEIRGYVVLDPVPFLVSDPYWLGINKPIPDSAYILLTGSRVGKIVEQIGKIGGQTVGYEGRFVKIRGNITSVETPYDSLAELAFESNSITAISAEAPCCNGGGPMVVPICSLNASICAPHPTPAPRKFALLYSGGHNQPFKRYWNDLVFMYHVLRSKYGFPAENIFVVYKDGNAEPAPHCNMPDPYAANLAGLNAAFADLDLKIGNPTLPNNDLSFVFTTNHGGQYADLNADEGALDGIDESLFFYNQPGTPILDETFNDLLNLISPNVTLVGLYEQCHSGGFLKDCAAPNRINIAASGALEDSYGLCTIHPCMRYEAFSYFFTVALYGKYHDGSPLSTSDIPDRNGDTRVSILEAYWFAKERDVACCNHAAPTHFLDDDSTTSDGSNIDLPATPSSKPAAGNDGFKASTTFLD